MRGELGHLKIETRLKGEGFDIVMGECAMKDRERERPALEVRVQRCNSDAAATTVQCAQHPWRIDMHSDHAARRVSDLTLAHPNVRRLSCGSIEGIPDSFVEI